MEGGNIESMHNEEPRKRKFKPVRLGFEEMMAEFNACAIRPKTTLPAPEQRKERKKLERCPFNPEDFIDSPPKRSKLKQPKQSIPHKVRTSRSVNLKTTNIKTTWNMDKEKPKLVSEELEQAKSRKMFSLMHPIKLNFTKNNLIKLSKNQKDHKGSANKHSTQKEKRKSKTPQTEESQKLDISINTPDWKVVEIKQPNKKVAPTPTSELSPTECEFLELEKNLKMKDAETGGLEISNWEADIQQILEQDKKEVLKFQNKVDKIVDEFMIAQKQRNEKIMQILKTLKRKSKSNLCITPLKEISLNTNRKNKYGSHSDGKVLKKSNNPFPDKAMDKALNLYNSMRNISCILATPKLNRSSLQTPKSIKKSEGVSISKIIQKQCLMLHETPYKH